MLIVWLRDQAINHYIIVIILKRGRAKANNNQHVEMLKLASFNFLNFDFKKTYTLENIFMCNLTKKLPWGEKSPAIIG